MSAETEKIAGMRASSKWKRLTELDERHSKWRKSATRAKASLTNSLLNAGTKEQERKALLELADGHRAHYPTTNAVPRLLESEMTNPVQRGLHQSPSMIISSGAPRSSCATSRNRSFRSLPLRDTSCTRPSLLMPSARKPSSLSSYS